MTPEERARQAAQSIIDFVPVRQRMGCEPFHIDQMTAIIADAIQEAVLLERSACAAIADDERIDEAWLGDPALGLTCQARRIAAAIRKRGET